MGDRYMLKVRHLESHRYMVDSESGEIDDYLVDLEEHRGEGECSCPHYHFRLFPKIKKGMNWKPCKHLIAARYVENYNQHRNQHK